MALYVDNAPHHVTPMIDILKSLHLNLIILNANMVWQTYTILIRYTYVQISWGYIGMSYLKRAVTFNQLFSTVLLSYQVNSMSNKCTPRRTTRTKEFRPGIDIFAP